MKSVGVRGVRDRRARKSGRHRVPSDARAAKEGPKFDVQAPPGRAKAHAHCAPRGGGLAGSQAQDKRVGTPARGPFVVPFCPPHAHSRAPAAAPRHRDGEQGNRGGREDGRGPRRAAAGAAGTRPCVRKRDKVRRAYVRVREGQFERGEAKRKGSRRSSALGRPRLPVAVLRSLSVYVYVKGVTACTLRAPHFLRGAGKPGVCPDRERCRACGYLRADDSQSVLGRGRSCIDVTEYGRSQRHEECGARKRPFCRRRARGDCRNANLMGARPAKARTP